MEKPKQVPAFFFPGSREGEACWRPSADVYRTRDGWLLKFDLAGVAPEDVSVEVHGCRITVSGVRRDYQVDDLESYYSMEISYNRFERTVELPCQFMNPRVTLETRNGILFVRVTMGS
jgi:HSP20 family protein